MTPEQYQQAKEIFHATCDLPEPQRAERLAELAGGDELVRDHVRRLWRHDAPDSTSMGGAGVRQGLEDILESTRGGRPAGDGAPGGFMPETIGPFRILRRLGSGGMGDVFEAQQESPRRSVAIKLMRAGLHSDLMVRRFRREIEFLGRLAHPGIAQVYEAGVTLVGAVQAPYYAMELVHGRPLGVFAREEGLPLEARLRLFASICDTVQYAHQQGIIHRDLKPANILVQGDAGRATRGDSRATPRSGAEVDSGSFAGPQARILDFGIARAVSTDGETGGDAGRTLATEAGQIIGTIPYMSPEQIGGRAAEIDTRTDVYALGVILFELLTGCWPHATEGLSVVEAARVKLLPPLRLSSVDRALRGDLETIVGKALETDKARRYGSASDLAADVRRFLSAEMIVARPATTLYQLKMFARRNRAVVVAAGLAVLALLAGVTATTLQAMAAIRQRDVAERKTAVAEAVSEVLLDALTMATPKGLPGREARLIDAIEQTQAQAEDEKSKMAPEVRAVVLNIVGIIHRERGALDRAERVFAKALEIRRRVLGPDDPNLADSLNNLGLVRRKQERFGEAAALMQEAVDVQRRSAFPDENRLARNIYNLSSAYIAAGELARAKPLLAESMAMHLRLVGAEHEVIGLHYAAQANLAKAEGRWSEAQSLQEQALANYRRSVGPAHPSIAAALRDLAKLVEHNGSRPDAIAALQEADAMAQKVFAVDPPHPTLAAIRSDLLAVLRRAGRADEADALERAGFSGGPVGAGP